MIIAIVLGSCVYKILAGPLVISSEKVCVCVVYFMCMCVRVLLVVMVVASYVGSEELDMDYVVSL